jgi:excisionase family DNA binding protein
VKVPELLTTGELAEVLRVNPRTVERWKVAGEIPAKVNRGRIVRYVLADVLAALEVPDPVKPEKVVLPSELLAAHRAGKGGRR